MPPDTRPDTPWLFPPPEVPALAVADGKARFAVRRIFCVGRNYAEHAREMGAGTREPPFFFLKPACALLSVAEGSRAQMPYPALTADLHHELELVLAIGQGGSSIAGRDALRHICGYAVGLDMTRRDLQAQMKKAGRPWCIGKGFEHSAPMGALALVADNPGLHERMARADMTLHANGHLRQSGNTGQMTWGVADILAHLSRAWTLGPGDLVMTGTPAGVGAVLPGDVLDACIHGLPALRLAIA